MAPVKSQKRAAADIKKVDDVKRARAKEVADAVQDPPAVKAVVSFIEGELSLPASVREMLTVGLRGSLTVAKDARHEIQTAFVDMIEEAIRTRELLLQEAVDYAKQAEVEGHADVSKSSTRFSDVESQLKERQAAVEVATAANVAALEGVAAAKRQLESQQDMQKACCVELTCKDQDLVAVNRAIEHDLKEVMEGNSTGTELIRTLGQLKCDESLIQALPGMCAKAPSDRGPFDAMVVTQLESSLRAKLAELAAGVAEAKRKAEQQVVAVQEAETSLAAAEAKQAQAEKDWNDAEQSRLKVGQLVDTANAEFCAHKSEEEKLQSVVQRSLENVNAFKVTTRTAFDELRDAAAQQTLETIA